MSDTNPDVTFVCSKCGLRRKIPRSKFLIGKVRFRVTCQKCSQKTVIDLSSGQTETSSTGSPARKIVQLQARITETPPNGLLSLPPGEFLGQVTIDHPITVEGQGSKTWIGFSAPPVIKITCNGVLIRNVMIETTANLNHVAIEASPGTEPILEDVIICGRTSGIPYSCIRDSKKLRPAASPNITFSPPPPLNGVSPEATLGISPLETETSFPSRVVQKVEALWTRAEQLEFNGDWQEAAEAYLDILVLSPDHPDAKKLLERARMKLPQALASAAPQPTSSPQKPPATATPIQPQIALPAAGHPTSTSAPGTSHKPFGDGRAFEVAFGIAAILMFFGFCGKMGTALGGVFVTAGIIGVLGLMGHESGFGIPAAVAWLITVGVWYSIFD